MIESDLSLCPRIVWRLEANMYRLECVVDQRSIDKPHVLRIVENGREVHAEELRTQARVEVLSRQYMMKFYERLRRTL